MAKHNDTGKWGEDIACEALIAEGATIRERNWRMGHLEIDIVAQTDNSIVFAEVKTRSDHDDDPLEAITRAKMLAMVKAADTYLRTHELPHYPRFDVFAITGTPDDYRIEHIPDAFYPPLKTYR